MKIRESRYGDKCLELDGDILKGAQEAFREDRYIEAFALLHALIDVLMTRLYHERKIQKREFPKKGYFDPLGMADFFKTASYLFEEEIITKSQFFRLREFNGIRDKVIHRIVFRTMSPVKFTTPNICVTRQIATKGFDLGCVLAIALHKRMSSLTLGMTQETYDKVTRKGYALVRKAEGITASRTGEKITE